VVKDELTIKSIYMLPSRNQPCPCGSGKRYKHCCGLLEKHASATHLAQTVTIEQALAMANQFQQQQRFPEEEAIYRQILQAQPELAEIHYKLGNVLETQTRLDEAFACYQQAITLKPDFAEPYSSIAYLLGMQGRLTEAEHYYRLALAQNPEFAQVHNNLGALLNLQNHWEEANYHFQQALTLKPDFIEAYSNLGNLLLAQGRFAEAELLYRQALQIVPQFAEACNNLGLALQAQEKFAEAVFWYHQALEIKPDLLGARRGLGDALRVQGKLAEAEACYQQVLTQQPEKNAGTRIRLATLLPVIIESKKAMLKSRQQLIGNINQLLNSSLKLDDPFAEGGVTLFFLAYQGDNDRNLQLNLATLYEYACPSLLYIAPHCQASASRGPLYIAKKTALGILSQWTDGLWPRQATNLTRKIKIGFVSHFFNLHTIGKVVRGVIANLSRNWFHLHIFFISPADDEIARFIQQHADEVTVLPLDLTVAREQIANSQLDILCYTDIGMETFSYFLAFARLAPVQCTTWGHPVTTGIRNLDYFISSRYLEPPEDYEQHYSEKVVLLNSLLTYYYKPPLPSQWQPRDYFGWTEQAHIYLCPQSLFKLHPDFDPVLGQILTKDSSGLIVLVEGLDPYWSELLKQRFNRTLPAVKERIVFLPRQKFNDYLNLIAVADVILDPFHFGGGSTTYEIFAIGTPIVTYPSRFMRGRFAYGCYKRMGILDCIADTPARYVEIAIQLGTDQAYRERLKRKILAANSVLYEDSKVVREFEKFFLEAVA